MQVEPRTERWARWRSALALLAMMVGTWPGAAARAQEDAPPPVEEPVGEPTPAGSGTTADAGSGTGAGEARSQTALAWAGDQGQLGDSARSDCESAVSDDDRCEEAIRLRRAFLALDADAGSPPGADTLSDIDDIDRRVDLVRNVREAIQSASVTAWWTGVVEPTTPTELEAEAATAERAAIARAGNRDDAVAAADRRIRELQDRELSLFRSQRTDFNRFVRWGNREWRISAAAQLLTFTSLRRRNLPARERTFDPEVGIFPNVSLLILNRPCAFRAEVATGRTCPGPTAPGTLQVASIGLNVLLGIDTGADSMPRFGVGAALAFLDDIIGLSVGVDLYRAIRTDDGDAPLHTGLLALAFATEGEFTPENFWIGVFINIEGGLSALAGR